MNSYYTVGKGSNSGFQIIRTVETAKQARKLVDRLDREYGASVHSYKLVQG